MSTEPTKFVQKVKPIYVDRTGLEIPYQQIPLPYEMVQLAANHLNIANGALATSVFTAANWGAGLNFFVYGITFYFQDIADFNDEIQEGIYVSSQEFAAGTYIISEIIHTRPILYGALYICSKTFFIKDSYRILPAQTLVVTAFNGSGNNLDIIGFQIRGVAI